MTDANASAEDQARQLAAVRAGDADASRQWVESLYPLVLRIVRSHRPRASQEEDLAQEVFLKLFSRLDQYQPHAGIPFEHWVSRVAIHTCLDRLRYEQRRPEVRASDLSEEEQQWLEYLTSDADADPSGGAADFSAVELVGRLLSELSPEDRLVIQWMDLEQRSTSEIAERTGWSRAAIKVRAFRARHRLRRVATQLKRGKSA